MIITVNFRKKIYSCQAITHFFTNYQILPPKKIKETLHFFPILHLPTAIAKKHPKKDQSTFLFTVYDRTELTSLKIVLKKFTALLDF